MTKVLAEQIDKLILTLVPEKKDGEATKLLEEARQHILLLEDKLFEKGAFERPPCFICGYKGPGYFKPAKHKCAARYHKVTSTF